MNELHLPIIKIGSGEVTNIPYLRQMASYGKPIILSTGMATLVQVAIAYDTLLAAGASSVALLHCTTNYPCPKNEVNLRAMQTMREAFKCQVGYPIILWELRFLLLPLLWVRRLLRNTSPSTAIWKT